MEKGGFYMKICVYGASSNAIDKSFIEVVERLGKMLVERGHSLVYGAGAQGLMGAVARGVHSMNGEILGVSPRFFDVDGVLFEHCTELIYTDTMRQRKQIMEDSADCFIMVPGGIGTFEEFFEILTLKQLGQHKKPIAVFNINGYYKEMNDMIEKAIEQKFMKEKCRTLFELFDKMEDIFEYLENYTDDYSSVLDMKNI